MRHFADQERRDRIARRHALAPGHRVGDAESAVRAMTVLHATEPPTVYLSVACRVDGVSVADVDAALFEDRSLVRQLAMRRTLFVFPRDLLPATWGSAAARVAATERAKLAKDLVAAGLADDGHARLALAEAEILAALDAAPGGLTTTELRAVAPAMDVRALLPSAQVNPGRFLTVLGAEGR